MDLSDLISDGKDLLSITEDYWLILYITDMLHKVQMSQEIAPEDKFLKQLCGSCFYPIEAGKENKYIVEWRCSAFATGMLLFVEGIIHQALNPGGCL